MKKLVCFSSFILLLVGCSDEVFNLSVQVSGKGTYEISPQKSFYEDGETVTITATADSGWKFNRWLGDVNTNNNPLHLTMDGNMSIQLIFSIPFEPTMSGSWEGVQLPVDFNITQVSIFDSTITGEMVLHLLNGSQLTYSVTGYNRVSVIIMKCRKTGYYDITYTGWWSNQSKVVGRMQEAGTYYDCDLIRQGEAQFSGKRIPFTPKKLVSTD